MSYNHTHQPRPQTSHLTRKTLTITNHIARRYDRFQPLNLRPQVSYEFHVRILTYKIQHKCLHILKPVNLTTPYLIYSGLINDVLGSTGIPQSTKSFTITGICWRNGCRDKSHKDNNNNNNNNNFFVLILMTSSLSECYNHL